MMVKVSSGQMPARSILRKIIQTGAMIVLLTGAAFAQAPPMGLHVKGDKRAPTTQQQAYEKALDKAYRSAKETIPVPEKKADPWADVRPSAVTTTKNKQ